MMLGAFPGGLTFEVEVVVVERRKSPSASTVANRQLRDQGMLGLGRQVPR